MLSKRYVPTQIQNLAYEESLTRHYRKLDEIHKVDAKKKKGEKEFVEKTKYSETREKTIKFHINERTQAIEKDNELLLGRLVEISRKKPKLLNQIKSETTLPKTLNGPSRRREKDRIAAENEAFARRLLSQQPSFNPKKLELDYEKHNQRVKNMQKIVNFSPKKFRLPPLKHDVDLNKDAKKHDRSVVKKNDKKKSIEELQNVRAKSEGDENVEEPKEDNVENNQNDAEDTEAVEKAAKEAAERKVKEAAEKAAKEAAEKEAAEKAAKEAAEKEAAEKAAKENSEQAAKEAAEKAAKETAEKEAAEKAAKEAAEKEAAEKAAKEVVEKEAAEKAAKEAAEKEAAEKAAKEAAEREAENKVPEAAAAQENKENNDKPASQKEVQPPTEQAN